MKLIYFVLYICKQPFWKIPLVIIRGFIIFSVTGSLKAITSLKMGFWVSGGGGSRSPGCNSFSYNSFRISETTIFRNICQWLLLKKVLLKTISSFWVILRDTPKERLFLFNTILDSSKRLNSPISFIKSSPCKRVTYRNLSIDSQYKPLLLFLYDGQDLLDVFAQS